MGVAFVDRQIIRVYVSYARLFVATCLFMGGLACLYEPSPAASLRDVHWRERMIKSMPENQISAWIEYRDEADARSYAALRLFGVLLGGIGLAVALCETAYLNA